MESEIGGSEPRESDPDMTVGEFVDGLPPHGLETSVFIGGKWWNVKRIDIPGENDAQEG